MECPLNTNMKRQRLTLARLKKAGVVIAILDLILTISDTRNVGKFFLLLTTSSTFDIIPENIIRDHCRSRQNVEGICETYAHHAVIGNGANLAGFVERGRAYFGQKTYRHQVLPEMFKELVISWKSMFDQSRADANISLYYDDGQQKTSTSSPLIPVPTPVPKKPPKSTTPSTTTPSSTSTAKAAETTLISIAIVSAETDNKPVGENSFPGKLHSMDSDRDFQPPDKSRSHAEYPSNYPIPQLNDRVKYGDQEVTKTSRDQSTTVHATKTTVEPDAALSFSSSSSPYPRNLSSPSSAEELRIKREVLSNRENAETENALTAAASMRPVLHVNVSKSPPTYVPTRHEASSYKETSKSPTGGLTQIHRDVQSSVSAPISVDDLTTIVQNQSTTPSPGPPQAQAFLYPFLTKEEDDKAHSNAGPVRPDHPEVTKRKLVTNKISPSIGSSHSSKGETGGSDGKKDDLPVLMRHGPKKIMSFLQEEMFSRWPCLLETVGILQEEKNLPGSLRAPEGAKIKMHIELKPFGPEPFKEAGKRLKATQQILFDMPWVTMFQLQSKLSGSFVKTFMAISLYTWIWGAVIALLLLVGSLTEDQTILHGWMIFNILYTFLQFMIDDWIHVNINPDRSPVSYWLFVLYSVYKPLAAIIGFSQWSEMKNLASLQSTSYSSSEYLHRHNNGRSCSCGGNNPRKLQSNGYSREATKDSGLVEIITSASMVTIGTGSPLLLTERGSGCGQGSGSGEGEDEDEGDDDLSEDEEDLDIDEEVDDYELEAGGVGDRESDYFQESVKMDEQSPQVHHRGKVDYDNMNGTLTTTSTLPPIGICQFIHTLEKGDDLTNLKDHKGATRKF